VSARTVHIFIDGRVQGVWFRGWTIQQATALGITGWVRNRSDGRVEAVFSGEPSHIDAMLERCRKGPPLARVDSLDISEQTTQKFSGFDKRATE